MTAGPRPLAFAKLTPAGLIVTAVGDLAPSRALTIAYLLTGYAQAHVSGSAVHARAAIPLGELRELERRRAPRQASAA